MNKRIPKNARRDFVAGCLVIKDDKLLLIDHKKYGIWLPPGGHVEERETPDETAVRETLEETGFEVELKHSSGVVEEEFIDIPRPFNVNVHRVEQGHWHCDYLYLAEVNEQCEATHGHENEGMKWFSHEELHKDKRDIPEYIRKSGKRAIGVIEDQDC